MKCDDASKGGGRVGGGRVVAGRGGWGGVKY